MGLEQRRFFTPEFGPSPSVRLAQIRQVLKTNREDSREKPVKNDGFEPFTGFEPNRDQLFVNEYSGMFSANMQFNRAAIERVLQAANLNGKVFITNVPLQRTRSADGVNEDGSVAQKRALFKGENTKIETKLSRIVPIPSGWRIEIDDNELFEHLQRKKPNIDQAKKQFIGVFSQKTGEALFECIHREKLSSIKDPTIMHKSLASILPPTLFYSIASAGIPFLPTVANLVTFFCATGVTVSTYIAYNDNPNVRRRHSRFWEAIMPPIEIDTVMKSFFAIKGKTMVKEIK